MAGGYTCLMKSRGRRGSTLVEAVVALGILCCVITVLLAFTGVLLAGRRAGQIVIQEGTQLNTIRDESAAALQELSTRDQTLIVTTIATVVGRYPPWTYRVEGVDRGLVTIVFIYPHEGGAHYYRGKIFTD